LNVGFYLAPVTAFSSHSTSFIQRAEFSCQPSQAVHENQPADEEQQRAAKYFDGVQMFSEALVELEKLPMPTAVSKNGIASPAE